MSVFVIAEAGVNHNGNLHGAMALAMAARDAGTDAVKFQLFKDRPEIEHLRLSEMDIRHLSEYCQKLGVEMMCTPFYLEAVAFLDPLVKRHKIASGWMKDRTILDAAVATGKQVIASMGMYPPQMGNPSYAGVSFLHCISLYPCPDEEANLSSLQWRNGYSDHTVGTLACVAAVALGAKIIEKHITLDKTLPGPDHSCSAEPDEFADMVRQIRRLEVML